MTPRTWLARHVITWCAVATVISQHAAAQMTMMSADPLGVTMERMGSGTTWIPEASPIPSFYFAAPGRWDITGHGYGFAQYDRQGGTRGETQFGSLNWAMLMAAHTVADGRFQLRTMLSLDAVGVTPSGYPLLLQSGEAYNGRPLHDRQHPHDLFMELSALYERPMTKSWALLFYAAPSGEPALGPVAFMHRPSAADNPTVPISHHWQDATHISFGVLTAGLFTHTLRIEGSAFNGREPDQYRFNFDPIRLDSYSTRITYNPAPSWSFSSGYGYIKSPEALEPLESMHRVTASALHGARLGSDGQFSLAAIYGANKHHEGVLSSSILVEAEAIIDRENTVFARAEQVEKSAGDLVLDVSPFAFASSDRFTVRAVSLGYVRELSQLGRATVGLGASTTLNILPSSLANAYGSRTPVGAMLFFRIRPARSSGGMDGMEGMKMDHM